jgi:hypothetical protein
MTVLHGAKKARTAARGWLVLRQRISLGTRKLNHQIGGGELIVVNYRLSRILRVETGCAPCDPFSEG